MASIFSKKQKQSITAMALALGLRVFGVSLFLPVFTLFGHELTDNGMLIGLALGVYGLVQAVLQVPLGALSDRFGRKKIILCGLFLYAVGSIMAAESHDIYFLIFARILQGAGAISGAVYAYIADVIEIEKRSRAMSLLGMPMGIAFSLGIVLGPVVASWWSVRALFVMCAILVVWAFLYIQTALEEPKRLRNNAKISIMPGNLKEILSNRKLLSINLGGFITNFFQVGVFVILPLFTVRYRQMADFWQLIVPMVVIGTLIMMWGARQADAGKSKLMTRLAFGFLTLSSLTFLIPAYSLLANPEWNFRMLILSGVLFFAGFSMTQPLLSAGVTKLASDSRVGATSGLYNMSQNMGTFFGGLLGGTFMSNNAGTFLILMGLLGLWGVKTVGNSMIEGGQS